MRRMAEVSQTDDAGRAIRARILNVLPAATFHMDRFFQFADVVLSDRTETACVEVGPQPRLHLNAGFVGKFCRRDEHLLMLVLHELYHVILGHTRLFPRLTKAHNIAFDAVINSMLCRQFRDPLYVGFFTGLNGARRYPGRLLRPPQGWPGTCRAATGASPKERELMSLLYGPRADSVTYEDILGVIQPVLPDAAEGAGQDDSGGGRAEHHSNYVLLGDHGGQGGSGEKDEFASKDPLVREILQRVAADWPVGAGLRVGRGDGRTAADFLMPTPRSPRAEFTSALKRLLDRAGVLRPEPKSPYAWKRLTCGLDITTVLPDWRDRHVHAWEALTCSAPLLYRSEIITNRPRWRRRRVAHVYIDISGSMSEHLPWLAAALEPVQRGGQCRVFAFSTVVVEIRRGGLLKDRIPNTFGTKISCVYDHLLALPRQQTPRQVVVITDGVTGRPQATQVAEAQDRKVRVTVGLVGSGSSSDPRCYAAVVEPLPSLGRAREAST